MRGVSKAQIETARQISVLEYFQTRMPQELVKISPHDFRTRTHSSLVISDNGLFHWFSKDLGGRSALDYLLKVEQMDFVGAVRHLNQIEPFHTSFQPASPLTKKPFIPFQLPPPDLTYNAIQHYLFRRGISRKVFQFCIDAGILYQTTHGRHTNCVFLGLDVDGIPRAAFLRGCEGSWRCDAPGSQKKYGFLIPAEHDSCTTVAIFEALIDALSGACLMQHQRKMPWRSQFYLSLGGLNFQAVEYFLETHPQVRHIRLCLDNDERGRAFSSRLFVSLSEKGYRVTDCPPRIGKDYNEQLLLQKQQLTRTPIR